MYRGFWAWHFNIYIYLTNLILRCFRPKKKKLRFWNQSWLQVLFRPLRSGHNSNHEVKLDPSKYIPWIESWIHGFVRIQFSWNLEILKIPGASHRDFYGGCSKHVKNQSTCCEVSNPSHFQNCVPTWLSFHRPRSGNTGWVVVLFKIQIRYITHLSVFISINRSILFHTIHTIHIIHTLHTVTVHTIDTTWKHLPSIPSTSPTTFKIKKEKLQEPSLSMCQDHKVETIPCLRKDLEDPQARKSIRHDPWWQWPSSMDTLGQGLFVDWSSIWMNKQVHTAQVVLGWYHSNTGIN